MCIARNGQIGAAWRGWVWLVGTRDDALATLVARRAGHAVFDLLAAETRCMWTRAALMRAASQYVPMGVAVAHLRVVEQRYQLAWNMENAQLQFLERAGKMQLSDGERERGRYMFHYARRVRVAPGAPAKRKHVNGETVRNRFVAFRDAAETLRFFLEWDAAEAAASLADKTMVFECGSYADDIQRKWVIDVDADLAKLTERQRAEWSAGPDAIVAFATSIGEHLRRLGYLRRPCHIAITSRHVPGKKLSWHVTLCALASFAQWREAMRRVVKLLDKDPMQAFVDERILRNSKSQFIQILGSTKVTMGYPCNGICFEPVGLYHNGAPLPMPPRHLFFAATSLMVQDPWSLPFARVETKPTEAMCAKQKKKTTSVDAPKTKTGSCTPPQAWMRTLIGTAHFTTPPCIQSQDATCSGIDKKNIMFYACAIDPAMCPRTFAAEGRVYQHGSDRNAIVVCTASRLFMRCFSSKCKKHPVPPKRAAGGGVWVELFESDLVSDAVRLAVSMKQAEQELLVEQEPPIVATAEPKKMIPRHRRTVDGAMQRHLGAGLGQEWEPLPSISVPSHTRLYGLLRPKSMAQPILIAKNAAAHCARHPLKTADAVVLIEYIERCSGAFSYHLFVTCPACKTEFADPWAEVL